MNKNRYELKKQPLQSRSKFTVGVIKEAATHILKEQGLQSFNTNLAAERAGVSIGSLYQYFPSKEVLLAEIKREHFNQLRKLLRDAYEEHKDGPLVALVEAMIRASIAAHADDPELHRLLSGDLENFEIKEDDGSDESSRLMVEQILERFASELREDLNIPLAARLVCKTVEHLTHDAVLNQPELLHNDALVYETRRMVMAYLCQPETDSRLEP